MGSAVAFLLLDSSTLQGPGHVRELSANRPVDHLVAHGDVHAPYQFPVHRDARLDAALEAPGDVGDQAVDLRIVEREGAADLRLEHAFALVLERRELRVDLRQQREAVVGDQHAREIARLGREILPAQRDEQVVERLRADVRVADARPHLRIPGDLGHRGEHAQPFRRAARLLGETEHGLGVGPRDGGGLGHQISCFNCASSWAWALASTSRRRIFSAPATASVATCSRSASFARATCWSMSALAAARMRSASARAAAFASSSICASRFSAEAMISPTRSRALASSSPARLPAASSSCFPRSPAARPSAIVFWRCSIARISGGQMNLTQNQMKSAKARACAIRVKLRFMVRFGCAYPASAPSSGLAKAKNMPMPSPMMNEASIRPSSRNTFACSDGIISGWRAAPSRKRLHMIPTPTHAPSAPSPTMRPMPTPVYAWTRAMSWSFSIMCFPF